MKIELKTVKSYKYKIKTLKNFFRVFNIFNYFYDKTFIVISHRKENMDLYDRIIKIGNGKVKEIEERYR